MANALGLNGASGNASALSTLENTPGYQFALQQGEQAVDRGAAAQGLGTSGNALNAEDQYAQGLASQTYNNYVSQLQPYLGVQENAASGISNANLTTGSNLSTLNSNQGTLAYNTQTGIGNAQAAADTAAQNAENSFINGAVNAVGNIGGALLGKTANAGNTSDIRLKRDVVKVGKAANGINLYRYRYLWSDVPYIGVMAQEVQKVRPDAVSRGADGYLRVHYDRLGLRLQTLDEWLCHQRQAA